MSLRGGVDWRHAGRGRHGWVQHSICKRCLGYIHTTPSSPSTLPVALQYVGKWLSITAQGDSIHGRHLHQMMMLASGHVGFNCDPSPDFQIYANGDAFIRGDARQARLHLCRR